jgi:hypothetical protein
MEVRGQLASSLGRLNAAERTSSNRRKGGPIAGLDVLETRKISYPCRESNL